MPLATARLIQIPDAEGTLFDHGAFDPRSRRVFVAHTARHRIEVIAPDAGHVATLHGFAEVAGVVAGNGCVLATSRGAAQLVWIDGETLRTVAVFETGRRPNGVALSPDGRCAIAACIGDDRHKPQLQTFALDSREQWSMELPGRPRWCVTDRTGSRLLLAIQNPSMVLAAGLPRLDGVEHWPLPFDGAHGMDIDLETGALYVACDGGALLELDTASGDTRRQWPLAGSPDATFFNPTSGLVHVAVADPGLVQTIDTRRGTRFDFVTARGAKTTALVPPDRLYVMSPAHKGVLDLVGA